MLTDIWTVTQKELKEIVVTGGGGRGRWSFLIFLGVFGVFLPLQGGVRGLETGQVMIFFAWVPFMLASTVIADTFAGERERHTLETLLATRLSDRAILFGKMFAAILYALGLLLASIALSVVTVNIVYRPERFTMYPPLVLIIVVAVSALGALLATGIGVLVSLRASTTRQAQQTMGLAIIALFLPFYVIPFLPEPVVERGVAFLKTIPPVAAGAAALAFVLVLNAVIIRAALARFKRSRLILD
ncbi:MAG TPA: ABC transporter permease [Aggregatilineales bacterium]|nr:ABC transporter permease [Aggregatilineales bacterium]HPV07390.1 ABC transporter permease [Aggregatilineales bacterium]HQA67913.1 ABC transporter permease [Aggregatilineales bacterium]HQE18254.1 ABC transporter permease [Aggregatilineales bacterium]